MRSAKLAARTVDARSPRVESLEEMRSMLLITSLFVTACGGSDVAWKQADNALSIFVTSSPDYCGDLQRGEIRADTEIVQIIINGDAIGPGDFPSAGVVRNQLIGCTGSWQHTKNASATLREVTPRAIGEFRSDEVSGDFDAEYCEGVEFPPGARCVE